MKKAPNIQLKLKNHLLNNWIFYSGILLLTLLLFKNPFSGNNLISSFQPFPDALIYIYEGQSLAQGKGLTITYNQIELDSTVPPLYPTTLALAFLVSNDPRSFYFINIILTLSSTIFFYKILLKLFRKKLLIFTLFFVYITNTIVFTYPSLPMSENLLILLFIVSIYLIISPLTTKKSIILGLLATAFFATKYIAWTQSLSLIAILLLSLLFQKTPLQQKQKSLLLFFLFFISSFFLLMHIDALSKGQTLYFRLHRYIDTLNILGEFFIPKPITTLNSATNPAFSNSYFENNLFRYLAGLMGGTSSIAGRDLPTIPVIIGMISLIGIFINFYISKFKILSLYLLLTFLTTFSFILFFFIVDTRYLLIMIPIQIITFGIFYQALLNQLEKRKLSISKTVIIVTFSLAIILSSVAPIKKRLELIFLNDYSQPYETVQFFNRYFDKQETDKPLVITLLPPLYINFFTNDNYLLLPFSKAQHFANYPQIWDLPKKGTLSEVFTSYLREGKEIYLSSFLTDSDFFASTFTLYKQDFKLIEVARDCEERCYLYKVLLKE